MNQIYNIHLIGLGGIGAAYAAMAQDAGQNFSIICDTQRKERYEKTGFIVNKKPYQFDYVTESQADVDLILIVVKDGQLDEAIEAIKPYLSGHTIIMSLLNGITSEEIIMKKLNTENIVHAFSMATDAVRYGNAIDYTSKGKIVYGHYAPKQEELARKVEKILVPNGVQTERVDNIEYRMWWKFMINTGINQVSTLLRCGYGAFTEKHVWAIARAAMEEVVTIANHKDIPLSEKDINFTFNILQTMNPDGKTSMLQDVEAGRPTEVDIFAGEVIRLGKKLNIPTPVNQMLFHAIKHIEMTSS